MRSSALRLSPRLAIRGAGSGRCLRCVGSFSCPHGVLSSRVRYRRWACYLLFVVVSSRPIVLVQCRIAWRGWLLEKTAGGLFAAPSHSWECGRHFASPGCLPHPPIVRIFRAVLVCIRFRPLAIGLTPPLVSNKTGSKTGRNFAPVLDLPHRECECLRRWRRRWYATDVGDEEFFPFYSCFASPHSIERPFSIPISIPRPSPSFPLLSICLLKMFPRPRAWEARAVRTICGGGRTIYLLAFSFPRSALSLAARSLSLPCPVSLRRSI